MPMDVDGHQPAGVLAQRWSPWAGSSHPPWLRSMNCCNLTQTIHNVAPVFAAVLLTRHLVFDQLAGRC